jgi:hypothetical protein
MEYIFIFIVILLLFALFSKKDPNQKTIEVEMPNPDKCQDQTMLDFIENTPNYKLELVFKEYIKLGFFLKPLFLEAYDKKINSNKYLLESIEAETKAKKASFNNAAIFEVTGVHIAYRKKRIRNTCEINDRIFLQPEPYNKFDKDAIKVENYDGKLGYIKSDETDEVHPLIKDDYYSYISMIDDYDNYLRLEITVLY